MTPDSEEIPPSSWYESLESLTKQRQGDVVTIEVIALDLGDEYEAEEVPFAYIEYDRHDDAFNVAVGGRDGHYPVVLRHTVEHPQRVVISPPVPGQETTVDVIFRPNPGSQYKLTELTISGNKIVPSDVLRKLMHAQIGEPVNVVEMESDVTALQHLYGTRGYMAAAIKANQEVDDKAFTVEYGIAIGEGDIYTMGDLDIHGLDSPTTAKMQTAWTLRMGDTYNSDYPRQFAEEANKRSDEWNITIHESVNPKDKTVDVTLRFEAKN